MSERKKGMMFRTEIVEKPVERVSGLEIAKDEFILFLYWFGRSIAKAVGKEKLESIYDSSRIADFSGGWSISGIYGTVFWVEFEFNTGLTVRCYI